MINKSNAVNRKMLSRVCSSISVLKKRDVIFYSATNTSHPMSDLLDYPQNGTISYKDVILKAV